MQTPPVHGLGKKTLLAPIIAILVVVFILAMAGLTLYFSTAAVRASTAPIAYSASVYQPRVSKLCPGDSLIWEPTISVTASFEAPVVARTVETIWSRDSANTVIAGESMQYLVYVESFTYSPLFSYTLPLDIAPGSYEMRRAVMVQNFPATAYQIPFTIQTDCPKR
jgi:hypothetical protein